MKIRIIKPNVNAIDNSWGYEYDYSDTMEIDLFDDALIDKLARVIDRSYNSNRDKAWEVMRFLASEIKRLEEMEDERNSD
jgi:hypothetical protein